MRFQKLTAAVVLLFAIVLPTCLGAEEYGLRDLYRLALERAEKIRLAEEDVVIAAIERDKAVAPLLPGISSFSNYTRYNHDKYGDYGILLQPKNTASWGFKAEQRLSLSMRELVGVSMASKGMEKSRLDLAATKEEYLVQVAVAYYEVLKAQKDLATSQANLERLTTYRDAATKRVLAGESPRMILLRAESERAGAESELIKARDACALARVELANLVGIDAKATLHEDIQPAVFTFSPDKLKGKAIECRADLKALDYQRRIARQKIWYMRGAYFPNVSLSAVSQASHQNPSEEDFNSESLYGTLALNFPLFQGGMNRAGVAEAMSTYRQSELQYEYLRKTILKEVEVAAIEVSTQEGVIVALRTQLAFARDNYAAVLRQFQLGLASNLDVLDANTQLVASEQKLAWAALEYEVAILKLKKAAGSSLMDAVPSADVTPGLIEK